MIITEPSVHENLAEQEISFESTPHESTISPSKENLSFLSQLTKISSQDFIGKELCTVCLKNVSDTHQAISCSNCDRWTHRKCTLTITKSKYKKLSQMTSFNWFCLNCRESETPQPKLNKPLKLDLNNSPCHFSKVKKGKNELLIMHINCRSMVNKQEEVFELITLLNPDIICMSETWLDGSIPTQYVPPGYKIIRKDRSDEFLQKYRKIKGGGLAIIHRSYINITQKPSLTENEEEILWVHVKTNNSFLLGLIYRPEYSTILHENEEGECILEQNIRKAAEISDRLIIMGDFNIDLKNTKSKNAKDLVTICDTFSLTQQINKVTRVDLNTGKGTLIDHIWTTPQMEAKTSGTCLGISDHLGTYIKFNKNRLNIKASAPKKLSRSYKTYDPLKFSQETEESLKESKIERFIQEENLDAATEELVDVISSAANKHAPLILRNNYVNTKSIPWMTKELSTSITHKNELLNDYLVSRDPILKKSLDHEKNQITTEKRLLKQKWIEDEITKAGNDPYKLWKLYNYLIGREKDYDTPEPENIDQEKANFFNQYFCNIGKSSKITSDTDPNLKPNNPDEKFSFSDETTSKIEKLIDNLKARTATGYDYLDVRLIKDLKKIISPILAKITNLGYKLGKFPNCMKKAIIKPIYKEGDQNKINNYRPIAILPIISKVIERAVTDQFMAYFILKCLLSVTQHAYLKKHSTITFLAEALNHIYQLVDQKFHVALVKLDLSKAFDTINHQKLLNKLANLGLDEKSLAWVESYLENRKQKTKFKFYTSNEENVTTGVPQGSILGPLLFICYTNDLADNFSTKLCKLLSYADDSNFIISGTSPLDLKNKIIETLEIAQNWFEKNDMRINTDKTEILIFKHPRNSTKMTIPITYQNKRIRLVPKPYIKVLGILVDENLSWTPQINRVKKSSMNSTRNVHRVNKMLPTSARINMYNTIIVPNFDYGDVIFGGCSKKDSHRLQLVQNFAVKSITGNRKHDSATQSFKKLNFLNLEQRRKVHESVFIHKAITNNSTPNLHKEYSNYIPKANTRRFTTGKLTIPTHNTSKFKKSPLYRTIDTWNSIPSNIPKKTIRIHKTHYQKYLISQTHHT